MKKLEISQMENLQGSGRNRDCALKGFFTAVLIISTAGAGLLAMIGAAAGGGISSTECF